MRRTWRTRAAAVIRPILEQHLPEPEERLALFNAYPFGERRYWPYKVWLGEIKRLKSGSKTVSRKIAVPGEVHPDQMSLGMF